MNLSTIKNNIRCSIQSKSARYKLYTLISIIVFILLWKLISLYLDKEILVPSPETTLMSIFNLVRQKYFWTAVYYTLFRTISGFIVALVSALVLGVAAGFIKPIYYLLKPFNTIVKATPTMSIILLALIWLNSEKAPILVSFLIVFPILYSNVVEGILNVDKNLLEMAGLYKIKKRRVIMELYIPSIKSYLFAAATTAIGLNLKTMISAEVLSQPKFAMGRELQMEKVYLNTANVFAWTIVIVIFAAVFDIILKRLKLRMEKWK